MKPERCLRCGRVGPLTDWPLVRIVLGFGTAAVALAGWKACRECVALVREIVGAVPEP